VIGFCVPPFKLNAQIWDNCDGKQARKTKNSSPLGMILDHGIDSANAWLCVMPLACICQFGEWWSIYFIWSVNVAYNMQLLELYSSSSHPQRVHQAVQHRPDFGPGRRAHLVLLKRNFAAVPR
jgi:phosphatidylglycerophosphate synthase